MPKPRKIRLACQSDGNQQSIGEPFDTQKTPRPREELVLNALVTGKAKTVNSALKQAGFCPTSSTLRRRFEPGGDLRKALAERMIAKGLTVECALDKVSELMVARKHLTIAGQALETNDNEAQQRAVETVLKLHERAGLIAGKQENTGNNSQITVNLLMIGET